MIVLHLSSDFARQKIYSNLLKHLSVKGLNQLVFVPVRTKSELYVNVDSSLTNIKYRFSHILNLYHKINYFRKIKVTFSSLENAFDLRQVDLIHAHFLFSDGGMALKARLKYGVKYVVAIRNADINYFYRYGLHLRRKGNQILENAESVIFISPGHKERLIQKYLLPKQAANLIKKAIVIPNGIDEFWLKNKFFRSSMPNECVGIIYIGEYSKNKNIEILIESVKILSVNVKLNISLTLIGEYGDNVEKIISVSRKISWIKSYPRMNKEELLLHLRNNQIFVMPSLRETFGLVYIEALSQGLPIIYTKGEGVDGYFNEGEVGYSVNPRSAEDVALKVMDILNTNYVDMSHRCTYASLNFNWNKVSDDYINLYKKVMNDEI